MSDILRFVLELAVTILVADFGSGLLHWLEDGYGRPHWPLIGRWVTAPNLLHHARPRQFTRHGWLRSAGVLLVLGGIVTLLALALDLMSWHMVVVVLLGINANEIHKWAHQSTAERPRIATVLQTIRLLQGPAHHARHHRGTKDPHYCVLTPFVNPLLERIQFWRRLEWLVARLLGVDKRSDPSVAMTGSDSAESLVALRGFAGTPRRARDARSGIGTRTPGGSGF